MESFAAVRIAGFAKEKLSWVTRFRSLCCASFAITCASVRSVFLFLTVALVNCFVVMGFNSRKGMFRSKHSNANTLWYSAVASLAMVSFFHLLLTVLRK